MPACLPALVGYLFVRVAKDQAIEFYKSGGGPRFDRAVERAERAERRRIAAELRTLSGDAASQPSERSSSVSTSDSSSDEGTDDSDDSESGSSDSDGGSVGGAAAGRGEVRRRPHKRGRMGSNGSVVVEAEEEEELYWSEVPSGVFASSSSSSSEGDDSDRNFCGDLEGSHGDGDGAAGDQRGLDHGVPYSSSSSSGRRPRRRRSTDGVLSETVIESSELAQPHEDALLSSQSEGQNPRHDLEEGAVDVDAMDDVVGQAAAGESPPAAAAGVDASGNSRRGGEADKEGAGSSREEVEGNEGGKRPPAAANNGVDGKWDEAMVDAPFGMAGGLIYEKGGKRYAGDEGEGKTFGSTGVERGEGVI